MGEDKLFELMFRRLDEIHEDTKAMAEALAEHVAKDDLRFEDVRFIKKMFYGAWAGLGMLLVYLGLKN